MIEAVLFDYGMVLSGPADPTPWERMRSITGLAEERFHSAYWTPRHAYDRGTYTGEEYWRLVGSHAGLALDEVQLSALLEADIDLWTQSNQPMIDWAARLQRAGTRTGILSNLGDAMTAGVLARMPWIASFDCKIFSHALKLAKPELEIYHRAAAGLGVDPAAILFVDDRADNCEAGLAAGMQVIRYVDHLAFLEEVETRNLGELWRTGHSSNS